jgi:hypothetical protein
MLTAQENKIDYNNPSGLKMETEYASNNPEIRDILSFEGIDYLKIKFSDEALSDKSYKLIVKEIWDGSITAESVIIDSKTIGVKQFETVNDSVLNMKVISKLTSDNQLKITFKFPRFSITKKYNAIKSDDYSLRNLADESDLEIGYNKAFYLLAYILPYEREDGSKSWCDVGSSGDTIEKWGKEFGIKHYLLFEMTFE